MMIRSFNYNKLKGRITEMFGNQKNFAEKIGWSESKLSKKLNNEVDFTQKEILLFAKYLEIDMQEVPSYFFVRNVQ